MSLKIEQLDLFAPAEISASSILLGKLFLYSNSLCMRIKPVAYMLNSTIVQEKLSSGHIMYVSLEHGKCSWLKGNTPVEPVTGKLSWSK